MSCRLISDSGQVCQYLVEGIVAPSSASDFTLVQLSGVDDDAQAQPLAVLWKSELNAEILSAEALPFIDEPLWIAPGDQTAW